MPWPFCFGVPVMVRNSKPVDQGDLPLVPTLAKRDNVSQEGFWDRALSKYTDKEQSFKREAGCSSQILFRYVANFFTSDKEREIRLCFKVPVYMLKHTCWLREREFLSSVFSLLSLVHGSWST